MLSIFQIGTTNRQGHQVPIRNDMTVNQRQLENRRNSPQCFEVREPSINLIISPLEKSLLHLCKQEGGPAKIEIETAVKNMIIKTQSLLDKPSTSGRFKKALEKTREHYFEINANFESLFSSLLRKGLLIESID